MNIVKCVIGFTIVTILATVLWVFGQSRQAAQAQTRQVRSQEAAQVQVAIQEAEKAIGGAGRAPSR